jgi:VWFA-related protein
MVRLAALALGVFFIAAPSDAPAVQRFASGVDAVRVDVLATDGRKPIVGLTARDFQVRDNGVLQDIALADTERLPLAIICAIDVSDSVVGDRLDALVLAGKSLLRAGETPDRFALLSFSHRVRLLAPLSHDPVVARRALGALHARGRTTLRDAAFAALALRPASPDRALVILFSDGEDTASWMTPADVLQAGQRSDAVVYPVVTDRTSQEPHMSFLKTLAADTGGRVIEASSENGAERAFHGILDEFRVRYLLAYVPKGGPSKGWHDIRVTLNGRPGTIVARRGYLVE